ncbi:MAG: hypothetical protein LBJ71_05320 [Holosporaceae bacterium]|jgi:hypothetical protein|nr:hypothetical protein [Holosporaceae bacterium]
MKKVLSAAASLLLLTTLNLRAYSNLLDDTQKAKADISTDLLEKKFLSETEESFPYFSPSSDIQNSNSDDKSKNEFNHVAKRLEEICSPGWEKLIENLDSIEEWANKNLTPHLEDYETVFYPFGGPDVTYPLKLFPKQKTYILVGLEPIGNFKSIAKNIDNPSAAETFRKAFASYFRKGYFITSEMVTQLSSQNVRGVLCLILASLSKNGYLIHNIIDLSIDAESNCVERQKGMPDCIKIEFSPADNKDVVKSLFYVRTDLTNSNRSLSRILKLVEKSNFITFIKSASYVLHDRISSNLREFILNRSSAVVQDDTGVPFHFFSQNQWNIHAFGTYEKPSLPVFRGFKQNDLANFYKNHQTEDIPFFCGYGPTHSKTRSNLICAVRSKQSESDLQAKVEKKEDEEGGCPCKKGKKNKQLQLALKNINSKALT